MTGLIPTIARMIEIEIVKTDIEMAGTRTASLEESMIGELA